MSNHHEDFETAIKKKNNIWNQYSSLMARALVNPHPGTAVFEKAAANDYLVQWFDQVECCFNILQKIDVKSPS